MKTCTKCDQIKSLSDFSKNKKSKDGLQYFCISCFSVVSKQYYIKNKDKATAKTRTRYASNKEKCLVTVKKWQKNNARRVKNNSLLNDHGITIEQYEALFQKQDGKCAICQISQANLRIKLAVDHCHKTNKIRGLLCDPCNRGIGMLKEDKETLLRAADYIDYDRVLDMELNHVR